ncbi:hypothetical protein B2M26_07355 [Ferroacidibacillus organovorans]|uniref:Uncharacterized protein n=1 Tax=Ferroacidibacillus organovorans TaxID=1765683 RepID=A0A1V4ETZ2_9BACL|nr:hypothetical protein B2M26_07355 [Ferroacidibacillus organovorans]
MPLWAKGLLVIFGVSAVATVLNMANIFAIDRGTLVGVLALQTGFAAYFVSVSKQDHVERLIPVVRQIFAEVASDENELKNFVESTSFVTLQLPQRLAVYVLMIDILMCPFILLRSDFFVVWIITMTFLCMGWLLVAAILLRVELYAKWLSVQMTKIRDFLEKHGQDVLILLLFLGLFFAAVNWLKKQGESEANDPRQEQLPEPQTSIS